MKRLASTAVVLTLIVQFLAVSALFFSHAWARKLIPVGSLLIPPATAFSAYVAYRLRHVSAGRCLGLVVGGSTLWVALYLLLLIGTSLALGIETLNGAN